VVERLRTTLNIHAAIIVATALVFRDMLSERTAVVTPAVVTKDADITASGLVDVLWCPTPTSFSSLSRSMMLELIDNRLDEKTRANHLTPGQRLARQSRAKYMTRKPPTWRSSPMP
jgi:hypothetical protein